MSRIVAFLLGIFPGFFVVFHVAYAEESSIIQRLGSILMVSVTYLLMGALFGMARPQRSWRWGFTVSLPAIAILVWYSYYAASGIPFNIFLMILTIIAGSVGGYAGMRLEVARNRELADEGAKMSETDN